MTSVEYRPKGNNSILRSVLYDAWKSRCYWCNRPKDFTDIEIDHIIPHTLETDRLRVVLEELGLPTDFDVHNVANLAPICGTCNLEKTNQDFTSAPVVVGRHRKAQGLRQQVIEAVQPLAMWPRRCCSRPRRHFLMKRLGPPSRRMPRGWCSGWFCWTRTGSNTPCFASYS